MAFVARAVDGLKGNKCTFIEKFGKRRMVQSQMVYGYFINVTTLPV